MVFFFVFLFIFFFKWYKSININCAKCQPLKNMLHKVSQMPYLFAICYSAMLIIGQHYSHVLKNLLFLYSLLLYFSHSLPNPLRLLSLYLFSLLLSASLIDQVVAIDLGLKIPLPLVWSCHRYLGLKLPSLPWSEVAVPPQSEPILAIAWSCSHRLFGAYLSHSMKPIWAIITDLKPPPPTMKATCGHNRKCWSHHLVFAMV